MGLAAYGNVELQYDTSADAAQPTWAKLAGVKSIDGPNTQLAFLETTDFDSPNGFREFASGLRDPGQLQMTLNYMPADTSQLALETLHDSGAAEKFRLRLGPASTSGRTFTFSAFVESLGPSAEVDGVIEQAVTLRVTGAITRAAWAA